MALYSGTTPSRARRREEATMTLAIGHPGTTTRERRSDSAREVQWQSRSFRLFAAGLVALLASASGGIVAFVGPTFGFSGDGTGSWYWDLSHALLALVPGAVGCLVGATMMGYAMSRSRTLLGLGLVGLLAVASGAWFAIGPLAWPVLYSSKAYFVTASPLRELAHVVGYSLGPGLILAVAGGIAWGSETAGRVAGDGTVAAEGSALAAGAPAAVSPGPVAVPEAPVAAGETPVVREASPTENRVVDEAAAGERPDRAAARNDDTAAPVGDDEGARPGYDGNGGATMPE
jgi:hypothetical protein